VKRLLQFPAVAAAERPSSAPPNLVRRHLTFGWWSLFAYAALGLVLETLHGFKASLYLDLSNDTRRLMWTLAHAHGVLLGLIHVVLAVTLRTFTDLASRNGVLISRSLVAASLLLPGGFFLGGIQFYGGDPGLGILLVPPGAVLLLLAVALMARASGAVAPAPPAPRRKD
jgi:hypothetical protein